MDLAFRGIDANIKWDDSLHDDQRKDLKADFILVNTPFNDSDWGGERLQYDERWKYVVPPSGNPKFAWIQHFIYHLSPYGTVGFILSNGSLSSMTSMKEI